MAMADLNRDGGGAVGNSGGYALAREFLTVRKPRSLAFRDAAALPMCFLSAFAALYRHVRAGDTIYIPGGAGGVAHLAVQMAARTLGAAAVFSSGSTPESMGLARSSGAQQVFNYKQDDIAAEIGRLTNGRGVDIVYDTTYNETSFANTARMVREGGTWIVLGVGPGKTTRTQETESPVDSIVNSHNARHVNVNILRYFSEPTTLDAGEQAFLQFGLKLALDWEAKGLVRPHIGEVIGSSVEEINSGLQNMKAGRSPIGKTAVILDTRR
jgi:NADPH:quinone reductase-like Zn-dependent oxidoreductase